MRNSTIVRLVHSFVLVAAVAALIMQPSVAEAADQVVSVMPVEQAGALVSTQATPSSPVAFERPERRENPMVPLGGPVKISGPMVLGGDVSTSVLVAADGTRVTYIADQDTDAVTELYSVLANGGGLTKLNPPLVAGGAVLAQTLRASTRVVYAADQDTNDVIELYSVPIGGGASTKLNGPMVLNGDIVTLAISFDDARVVYIADQDTDTVNELYSVPIGGGAATKISGPQVLNGDVLNFAFTSDSSRVIYFADQDSDTVNEVYSVPIAGGTVTKLNPTPVLNGDVTAFLSAGGRTFYLGDVDTDAVTELYSVADAGGAVVKLNGPLVAGGNVTNASIGVARVIYLADQDANDVFEVYSVPVAGGANTKLNPALVAGGDVVQIAVTGNDLAVVYRADQDADEVFEMYSSPIAGGGTTKINSALVAGGDVSNFANSVVGSLPPRTLYFADQDADEVVELYGAPLPSGGVVKLNGPLVAGGDLASVSFGASGVMVYRADQDADEVIELYGRSTTGAGLVTKLNTPPVLGGDVLDQRLSGVFPIPTSVVYRADQDTDEVIELYSVFLDGNVDGDPVLDGIDCLIYDATVWGIPGEATALLLSHTGGVGGTTTLNWAAPGDLGGTGVVYDVVRSSVASDFVSAATCVETNDGPNTTATDSVTPAADTVAFFLVRAENVCGTGSLGAPTLGTRSARNCP